MRILVVSYVPCSTDRNTVDEHMNSFSRYSGQECYNLNVHSGVPAWLEKLAFDLIVFHYTFFAYISIISKSELSRLRRLSGYKIAMPQDEYSFSDRTNWFLRSAGVMAIYTCFKQEEWQLVYPEEKSGLKKYFTVYTGYVDEEAAGNNSKLWVEHASRPVDIGYRARKVPYWVGRFGLVKWQLTDVFASALTGGNLVYDLSNAEKDVFYGQAWYGFLSRCRVVLGCESGASMLDRDGSIRERVDWYTREHPRSGFDEVERECFPGLDNTINLRTLSPRHFEACITRTCQALVEGDYGGIFKPGVHYIEIKRDWSNISDVIERIKDVPYCEYIADNAYRDIIQPGNFTYRRMVTHVISQVPETFVRAGSGNREKDLGYRMLKSMEKNPFLFNPVRVTVFLIKKLIYTVLVRLDLYHLYLKYNYWKAKNINSKESVR